MDDDRRYRLLFENMLDGIAFCKIVLDPSGVPVDFIYIEVNPAFGALTGIQNVTGRRVTEVIPGIRTSNPELFTIYGRVAAGGAPEHFELEVKSLSLWLSISVYCPEKGYFIAVFENITTQKKTENDEEALVKSLKLYQLAIEHATNHIIITDTEGKVIFANKAVETITGFTREEVIGSTSRLWGGQMSPEFYAQFWHQIKDEKKSFKGEIHNKRKNGQLYWVIATVSPIIESGVLVGFIGVEEDITERKEAEDLLKKEMAEATKFINLTVGRELKMAELKKENEQLKKKFATEG